jgi:drug/metabolite transporter (DMT)-like permease
MRQTMNGGDWLRLGGLSVLWGGSFLFYRMLATELPPLTTVFGRVSLACVALLGLFRLRGIRIDIPRRTWRHFMILGTLNNVVPFTMFAWGETRVEGGTASILNAMTPLFAALVTGLLWRTEALTAAKLAGVGFGIAGVAVLVGPQALLGQDVWGQAACLLAAISYGFGVPYGRRIAGVAPHNMALGQLIASSLMLLLLALLIDRPWTVPNPSPAGWAALLGIAVLSTSVAYLIFFDLLARAGATNLALVTFLVPISALALGAMMLGETLTWNALAGMALIAAGLAAIDGRALPLVSRRVRGRVRPPAPGVPPSR